MCVPYPTWEYVFMSEIRLYLWMLCCGHVVIYHSDITYVKGGKCVVETGIIWTHMNTVVLVSSGIYISSHVLFRYCGAVIKCLHVSSSEKTWYVLRLRESTRNIFCLIIKNLFCSLFKYLIRLREHWGKFFLWKYCTFRDRSRIQTSETGDWIHRIIFLQSRWKSFGMLRCAVW